MCSLGDCWFDECVICMTSGEQTVAFRHSITTILCHYALIKSLTPTAQMHSTSFSLSFLSLSPPLYLSLWLASLRLSFIDTRCCWWHEVNGAIDSMSDEWQMVDWKVSARNEWMCVHQFKRPIEMAKWNKKSNQPGAHNEILMFLPSLLLHSHSFLLVHFLRYISSVFFSITHKKEREREIDREI